MPSGHGRHTSTLAPIGVLLLARKIDIATVSDHLSVIEPIITDPRDLTSVRALGAIGRADVTMVLQSMLPREIACIVKLLDKRDAGTVTAHRIGGGE